jgi:hypothetical protein
LQAALRVAVQTLFNHDTFPVEDALEVWRAVKLRRERLSKKWLISQKKATYTVQVASMKRAKVAR